MWKSFKIDQSNVHQKSYCRFEMAGIAAGGTFLDGRIYFSNGSHLNSYTIEFR